MQTQATVHDETGEGEKKKEGKKEGTNATGKCRTNQRTQEGFPSFGNRRLRRAERTNPRRRTRRCRPLLENKRRGATQRCPTADRKGGGRWNVGHETERKKKKGCQGTHTQIYATHRSVEMPAMIQTLTEHREERQSSLHTFSFLFYPTRQEQHSRLAQGGKLLTSTLKN